MTGDERRAEAAGVGERLAAAGLTVAVAESCTGGLLGAALSAPAGASRYLRGGVIAYADDVKTALLDVPAAVLATSGAVSGRTARLMAEGVRRRCAADIGVAVTGVAGPGGGAPRKPVGMIHVAVAGPGAARGHHVLRGDHGRAANRSRAVSVALHLLADMVSA